MYKYEVRMVSGDKYIIKDDKEIEDITKLLLGKSTLNRTITSFDTENKGIVMIISEYIESIVWINEKVE